MSLDEYIDPTLDVTGTTQEQLVQRNTRRLVSAQSHAVAALGAKRRLGGDATREQLAADKKLCRKIRHRTHQLRQLWGLEEWAGDALSDALFEPPSPLVVAADAGVVWPRFAADQLAEIVADLAVVATWARMVAGVPQVWAKQRVVLLERERDMWREIAGASDA